MRKGEEDIVTALQVLINRKIKVSLWAILLLVRKFHAIWHSLPLLPIKRQSALRQLLVNLRCNLQINRCVACRHQLPWIAQIFEIEFEFPLLQVLTLRRYACNGEEES